jgi:hypothetical protein
MSQENVELVARRMQIRAVWRPRPPPTLTPEPNRDSGEKRDELKQHGTPPATPHNAVRSRCILTCQAD